MGWATFWAIFSQTHLVTLWQGGETMPAQQAVHIHTMVCICTACWTTCGELQNVTPTSVTLAPRGELSPLGVKIPLFAPLPICLKGEHSDRGQTLPWGQTHVVENLPLIGISRKKRFVWKELCPWTVQQQQPFHFADCDTCQGDQIGRIFAEALGDLITLDRFLKIRYNM
jgi:hypothetical protein